MSIKERYLALEDTLLDMIASCVKIDENAQEAETDPEKWKIKKISESENLKQEAKKEIKKQLAAVPEELEAEMEAAADRETARTAEQFRQAVKDGLKLPVATAVTKALRQTAEMVTGGQVGDEAFKDQPDLDPLKAAMDFFYHQTYDRLNLTAATMLKSVKKEYSDLIYNTAAQLVDGEKTYQEAMRSCVARLANNNLTAFADKAGREWSPEAYVSMLLKTSNKNVTNLTSFANMDRYGYDLAQVSNHAGARPKCYPYQGKLVSKSGKSGTCEDGNGNRVQYVGLGDTSYGQPDGLLGINCGHYLFPFMPGVSTITSEVQPQVENDRDYALSQKQRELERAVRKAKREKSMAENANDAEGAKTAAEKVKQKQKKLREFINESGRTRRYDREQVFVKQSKPTGALAAKNAYYDSIKTSKPVKVGQLTRMEPEIIEKVLRAYESQIVNLDYEVSIVITQSGEVYRVKGENASVNIGQLGDKLFKASVTHNHPTEETRYSFSNFDLSEAIRNRFSIFRGIDHQYEYQLRILEDTPVNNGEKIYNEFRGEYFYKALDWARDRGDDYLKEEDEYHWINDAIAKEYGYEYWRKSRKK